MNTTKPKSVKLKYFLFGLLFVYILICQSCMTMRMSVKETNLYFETQKLVFESKTIAVDDHLIHYIQTGNPDKPTLFFVHGSPGSWDAYKQYLADTLLLKKYRMIAIDRPGFGNSNFGKSENLATQSKISEALLSKIDNHKPIVLIGHSYGGPLIVKMATEFHKRYQHLVILAGAIDPNAENSEIWRQVLMANPIRYFIPGAMRPANDELWWLKYDLVLMKPNLKNITCDITIIHGTKDQLVPYSNVAFINATFVNAKSIQTIAIENANHFIPWSHYEIIRDALIGLKL